MGCRASCHIAPPLLPCQASNVLTDEEAQSLQLDLMLRTMLKRRAQALFLGPPQSGKSTLIRQFVRWRHQHQGSSRAGVDIRTVHNDTITCIKTLLRRCECVSLQLRTRAAKRGRRPVRQRQESLYRTCSLSQLRGPSSDSEPDPEPSSPDEALELGAADAETRLLPVVDVSRNSSSRLRMASFLRARKRNREIARARSAAKSAQATKLGFFVGATNIDPSLQECKERVMELAGNETLDLSLATAIQSLWRDPFVQAVYADRLTLRQHWDHHPRCPRRLAGQYLDSGRDYKRVCACVRHSKHRARNSRRQRKTNNHNNHAKKTETETGAVRSSDPSTHTNHTDHTDDTHTRTDIPSPEPHAKTRTTDPTCLLGVGDGHGTIAASSSDSNSDSEIDDFGLHVGLRLPCSTGYFLNKVMESCTGTPTEEDALRRHGGKKSLKMQEYDRNRGIYAELIHLGHQRGSLRKYVGCFANITTVFFVADLSVYDTFVERGIAPQKDSGQDQVQEGVVFHVDADADDVAVDDANDEMTIPRPFTTCHRDPPVMAASTPSDASVTRIAVNPKSNGELDERKSPLTTVADDDNVSCESDPQPEPLVLTETDQQAQLALAKGVSIGSLTPSTRASTSLSSDARLCGQLDGRKAISGENLLERQLVQFQEVCKAFSCSLPPLVIVILNKLDVFTDKLHRTSLRVCPPFHAYAGPLQPEACAAAVSEEFTKRADGTPVTIHTISAIETETIPNLMFLLQRDNHRRTQIRWTR